MVLKPDLSIADNAFTLDQGNMGAYIEKEYRFFKN